MEEGNFSGESAWGYSEDNIFPSTPDEFEGSYSDNSITLSWNMINDEDFDYFTIYRGYNEGEGFVCDDGEILGYTTDPGYQDSPDVDEFVEFIYGLSSIDINDNESECVEQEIAMTEYSVGDINQDNNLNILDLVILIGVILENYPDGPPYAGFVIWACDLNNDEQLNVQDIVLLVNGIMDIGLN